MLIELRDELACPGAVGRERWHLALSNLALSHFEGKHFIIGSPSLLAALVKSDELDEALRGRFKVIRERTNDGYGLRGEARAQVLVHASPGVEVATDESGGRTIFNVGLSWFVDSARVQAMRLLAENPKDAEFYRLAVMAMVSRRAQRGVSSSLRLSGGGGSTTGPQLLLLAPEGGVVCVVDNDRAHVTDGLKGTAKAARAALEEARRRGALAEVLELPCRTIENLLPAGLVLEALPRTTGQSVRGRFHDAERRGELGGGKFADLKEECAADMLSHTLVHAQRLSAHDLAKHLFTSSAVSPLWLDLCETLMHWGLAPRRSHS